MAKITFTDNDGSTQDFEVIINVDPTPTPVEVVDVIVEKSDGSEEKLVPEA